MAAPFILFFIGQFVSPALNQKELKLVLPGALTAFLLFLAGAAFSFFLLVPSTIRVSLELNELLGFTQRWTPGNYYSLLMWLTVGVGAAFEFPLLIVLLVYLGMVSVAKLRSWWRHALVVIFIISAIVTPTPDPVTQTMLAVPLYALYCLTTAHSQTALQRQAVHTLTTCRPAPGRPRRSRWRGCSPRPTRRVPSPCTRLRERSCCC